MGTEHPSHVGVVRRGALRAWSLRVAARRLLRQWRLLLLVLAVAVIASTAVTSVGLLISATESSAVRTALAAIPSSQTEMSVNVEQSNVPIAQARTAVGKAIAQVLGGTARATPSIRAYSAVYSDALPGKRSSATYFGQLQDVRAHAKLIAGKWASSAPATGGASVDVDVPSVATKLFDLRVGSTVPIEIPGHTVTATVVGIYRATDTHALFWSQDPLNAQGNATAFAELASNPPTTVDAFGPLIVASGALDVMGVKADRLELDYLPRFTSVTPDAMAALIDRLQLASNQVPAGAGDIAGQVTYSGSGTAPLSQIAAALVVTRSTVVVITLLLLVLAIAALAQAARLFNEARAGDRQLMRARGASRGQVLAMATLEAAIIGVITAVLSPLLARVVYAVVADQPAMIAARMPHDAGVPATSWLTGAALGVVFVLVLVVSLIAAPVGFVAAEQQKSRQRRATGLLRSGLDLGIVVLAAIAFWQLVTYRSPVGAATSLAIDPVLVAAPALVLLAGTLLCARLIPLLARIADGLSSRSRGVLVPLAGWEVGRRSRRIGAVVLLLTLALAVGAFSQTFLATWQQSQDDQASFAVGPPVRVPADPSDPNGQLSLLKSGAVGQPQPTIRRVADVVTSGEQDQEDANAVVLGLTPQSRSLLQRGRENADGGAVIASALKMHDTSLVGIALPGDVRVITANAQAGSAEAPLPGVSVDLQAIVEDGTGVLSTVDLGAVPMDGQVQQLSGTIVPPASGAHLALPLTFVGFQASVFLSSEAQYVPNAEAKANILLGDISVTDADGSVHLTSTTPKAGQHWYSETLFETSAVVSLPGWQVGLAADIPPDVQDQPSTYTLTAWSPVDRIPVVFSSALAAALNVKTGGVLFLQFATATVSVEVAAITPYIPGSADSSLLTAASAAGADATPTPAVVVDQALLQRALAQGGESGSLVDEWWVDVAPGSSAAYLADHRAAPGNPPPRSGEVLADQMQQDPLRVATQAALWLAIGAAALLAAIGFAVHSASTMASRRVEFAQLRAIGLSRRRLVGLVGVESLLLGVLGVLFGLGVGVLLGVMSGPLIALSPNGTPAIPPVRVTVPWLEIGALVLVVAIVLGAVVVAVARAQRFANPASILREVDNG